MTTQRYQPPFFEWENSRHNIGPPLDTNCPFWIIWQCISSTDHTFARALSSLSNLALTKLREISMKNKTNHPILSNSHPSTTGNNTINRFKIWGVVQNQREHHIILTKYEAVHPWIICDGCSMLIVDTHPSEHLGLACALLRIILFPSVSWILGLRFEQPRVLPRFYF